MARLVDVPKVFRTVGAVGFARRVWTQMGEDRLLTWASALAYSWLFAVFPFVIVLVSLIPYLPPQAKQGVRKEIADFIYASMAKQAADAVWTNVDVDGILHQPRNWLLYVGLATSLWAASGGMAATMSALDRCYELTEDRPFWRQRLLALGLTIAVALLIVVVMALLPVGSALKAWFTNQHVVPTPFLIAFDVSRWLLALLLLVSILALVYYFGVNVRHKFHWLTPGGVFCLATWVLLGLGFRFYVDHFGNYNKTYGAVGGVAILLLLFYLDSAVLMVGAEINSEIDFEVLKVRRGTRNFLPAEAKAEEQTRQEVEQATRPLRRLVSRLIAPLTARFARRRPGSSGSTPPAP